MKKRGKKRFSHAEVGGEGDNKFCDSFNTGA